MNIMDLSMVIHVIVVTTPIESFQHYHKSATYLALVMLMKLVEVHTD